MPGLVHHEAGNTAMHKPTKDEIALLRSEIEMLMGERQHLLRVAGAAASLISRLDSKLLPKETWDAAEVLAESVNTLSEETLRDGLESVRGLV